MQRQRLLLLGLLLVGAATLLVLAAPGTKGADPPDGEPTRSFTLSADPRVTVLEVTHSGAFSAGKTVYLLYGDGRLRRELRAHGDQLLRSTTTSLSFEETRDLLDIAVDHGLVDITPAELRDQIQRRAPIVDAATMTVEIHLTEYTRDGEVLGPVDHQVRLYAPKAHLRVNPNAQAVKGLVALGEKIDFFFERHRSGDSG